MLNVVVDVGYCFCCFCFILVCVAANVHFLQRESCVTVKCDCACERERETDFLCLCLFNLAGCGDMIVRGGVQRVEPNVMWERVGPIVFLLLATLYTSFSRCGSFATLCVFLSFFLSHQPVKWWFLRPFSLIGFGFWILDPSHCLLLFCFIVCCSVLFLFLFF